MVYTVSTCVNEALYFLILTEFSLGYYGVNQIWYALPILLFVIQDPAVECKSLHVCIIVSQLLLIFIGYITLSPFLQESKTKATISGSWLDSEKLTETLKHLVDTF